MIPSTLNFEYALQLHSMKNNIFSLCETSNAFIHAFCHTKIHFQHSGHKLMKTMLKSFHVLLGLSPVWKGLPSIQ